MRSRLWVLKGQVVIVLFFYVKDFEVFAIASWM